MAGEITLTCTLAINKGNSNYTVPSSSLSPFTIDMTGTNFLHNRQTVGTTEEALLLGDVDISANGAWIIIVNHDVANYVTIRPATGATDLVQLPAGKVAAFKILSTTTAPFVLANTAACEVEYLLLEG